jgi:hypothetical protein
MQANDFRAAAQLLADDFVLDWPLTGERIRGRDNFVALNERYPAHGRWHFTLHRCLAERAEVVTEVTVTDGVVSAQAITFSTVAHGQISRQVEYWPEPYEPLAWRAKLVERIEN